MKSDNSEQATLRLSSELLRRIDAIADMSDGPRIPQLAAVEGHGQQNRSDILRVALARGLDILEQKVGPMNNTAATSPTIDVTALVADEEKRRIATDQALGLEVYEFLYKAVAEECSKKLVLGGDRCGKCLVCMAKVLEEKLRIRHVQLGWKLDACKSCKGTGVQKTKSTMK